MERKIFEELLELKRLQIRAGRANEQLMVKRLSDGYAKTTQELAGLKNYDGPYTFKEFEKYLYSKLSLYFIMHFLFSIYHIFRSFQHLFADLTLYCLGLFINHVDRNMDFFDPLPLCGPNRADVVICNNMDIWQTPPPAMPTWFVNAPF